MHQRLTPAQLAAFLNSAPTELCETTLILREFVLRATPSVDEAIKFHSLCYFKLGNAYGVIGGNVCMITPKQTCLHLGFIHGAFLPDPARLLRGTGKAKRFIEIREAADIRRGPIRTLLRAALAVAEAAKGWRTTRG